MTGDTASTRFDFDNAEVLSDSAKVSCGTWWTVGQEDPSRMQISRRGTDEEQQPLGMPSVLTDTETMSWWSYRHRNNVMVALTRLLGPIALQDDRYPNRARGGR